MRTLLLSVLVGLLGGVGLAFLRYYLDNTLKTPEDISTFSPPSYSRYGAGHQAAR